MIVRPNKSLFFVATALMCSASLYGAELSSPGLDPMTRVFVGEPNRLTLPPRFPATPPPAFPAAEISADASCDQGPMEPGFPAQALKASENACSTGTAEPAAEVLPRPNSPAAASAKAEISAQPISLGSAPRVH